MRKNIIFACALCLLIGIGSFGCMKGSKADVVRGTIISVDNGKNEIVIKDSKTGAEKTILVNPGDISSLKKGEEVKAKLQSGTNKAESIKPRSHKSKEEM